MPSLNLKEKLQKFCIECGKKTPDLINGLCFDCFQKKHFFVFPERIELTECRKCKKILFKGNYLNKSTDLIKKIIEIQLLKVQRKPFEGKIIKLDVSLNKTVLIELVIEFNNKKFKLKKELPLRIYKNVCVSCSRIAGGYFEAVIQLRLKERNAEKELKRVFSSISKKDALAVIVKERTLKEGKDFFIASRKAAKKAVNKLKKEFNAKLIISSKLAGVKEGKELKRMFYCLKD